MTYNLPAHGETDWDTKLNASIDSVKAKADAAETPAGAQAKADAAQSYAVQRANHTGTQTLSTISDAGTAAAANTGTTSGTVPLLGTGGVLPIARIATGTPDGTKFVADDGTLKTPAGGGGGAGMFRFPLTGWYGNPTLGNTVDAATDNGIVNGQIHAGWWPTDETITVTKIGTASTGATTGALLRAGIYADDGTGKPGALVVDAGTASVTGGGSILWSGLSVTLTPGMYWIAFVGQGSPTTNGIKAWGVGTSADRTWPGVRNDATWPEFFGSIGGPAWSSVATTYTAALPDPFPAAQASALQYTRVPHGSLYVSVV